ncbi:AraC family transcriptional regulator [Photobacterium sp. TY1-4]|uniref:AraC family transcriptional regulator n=1 Tax=Photobacterium sp. TY1-4 TaxID=2899122 RepID=UPI0021BE73E6|nr:AraC family transcriptional regulator [Photobacterium sp. TY1-4]UXI02594.1 AraC family transcriptional regulator [Photobacterium sp. TY1-4]
MSEQNYLSLSTKLAVLAEMVSHQARVEGDHVTAVPGLSLHRRNVPTEPLHCIYTLSLALTVQGSKQVLMGDEVIELHPGQTMITTLDLPVVSHVTKASRHQPYLGLLVQLDIAQILDIHAELSLPRPLRGEGYQAVSIEQADANLCDVMIRLLQLPLQPDLQPYLVPLIHRELIIRLLTGPHGVQLRQLATEGSPSDQISKVVAWLKQNFAHSLNMNELAERAHMSASTFRQHFRTLTGTSPLQFQKQLRLQEARELMLNQNLDASRASALVGYESASQFSREYSRLFGAPPLQDIRRIRQRS